MPRTAPPFDALRTAGRLKDLEWDDADEFALDITEILEAVEWVSAKLAAGQRVVINCAQGSPSPFHFQLYHLLGSVAHSTDME